MRGHRDGESKEEMQSFHTMLQDKLVANRDQLRTLCGAGLPTNVQEHVQQ